MRPWVRLAAMMPARRAAPSTSPFMALPSSTTSRVALLMITRPSAIAMRSVIPLAVTSTMRASPRWSVWVSGLAAWGGSGGLSARAGTVFLARPAAAFFCRAIALLRCRTVGTAREQCLRCGRNIRLAHQAFADQECRNPGALEARKIGRGIESALGYHNPVRGNFRRQLFADCKRRAERPQIAIVDADQPRFQLERSLQFNFIMNFNQDIHTVGEGRLLDVARSTVINSGHDDQNAIGTQRAGFHHLIRLVDEILSQDR